MKKAILFLLCLCSNSFAAEAGADAFSRIVGRIEQSPVVRASFEQKKIMPSLKRPLVLSGRLTYSRQYGVLWRIEKPYRVTYVLGEDKIAEIGSDGVRRERGPRDVPGLAQIGRIFRAMLGADTSVLQEYFDVSLQGDTDHWEVSLTPRQSQLAQFLAGMRLSGSRFVENLVIDETGGDSSQIRFTGTQGDKEPDAVELELFRGSVPE